MVKTFFALVLLASSAPALASKLTTYSLQVQAMAPNAGGQQAYALRRATDTRALSLFANDYLRAGDYPLLGGFYSLRFPICDQSCFWQFYMETGVGVSTIGPAIEVLWGTNLLWVLRLDVASHFYLTAERMVIWSYPLWVGLSFAF